ncbi:MAG TPA: hypothetical protein VIU46_06025 [Gallionellaceae bacterium]
MTSLTGAVTLFAGSPTGASGTTNGTGSAALFFTPDGITSDGTNLYVADQNNNQIRKIVISTGAVTLLAGSPTGVAGTTNATGTAALFNNPMGITTDGTNLYVTESVNNDIRKIVISTGAVTLFAGSPTQTAGMTNGTGSGALFSNPLGITTDGTNLYVADYNNNQIRQIVIATGVTSLLAGSTAGTAGMTNGTGTGASFRNPRDVATDGTNLYVTDQNNNQIRKIVIATGATSLLAGSTAGTGGMVNGTGTGATFNMPLGLATDNTNLYISDYGNNQIRKLVISTGAVSLLAGSATGAVGMANGTGSAASFNGPAGLCLVNGALYVGDFWNNEVRQIK